MVRVLGIYYIIFTSRSFPPTNWYRPIQLPRFYLLHYQPYHAPPWPPSLATQQQIGQNIWGNQEKGKFVSSRVVIHIERKKGGEMEKINLAAC